MIEIISKHPGPWYRLRRPRVLARVDGAALEGADLSGRNLDGAVLRDAVLNKVKLVEASLAGADLWGAKLTSANLQGAQLRGADLAAAVLVTANLNGARLDECNLWGANLAGARLVGASLAGADLSGARLAPANLSQANLNGARLINAYMYGARLDGASLRGAQLAQADLSGATLTGANLAQANLQGAKLNDADLSGASLVDVLMSEANLQSATLEQADLRGAVLRQSNLTGANLRCATLLGVDLEDAVLVGADLSDALLTGSRLARCNLQRARVDGAQLADARLDDADARDLQAAGAVFIGANLARANLAGAIFAGGDLRNANLWGANLKGADLRGANLLGASVTPEQLADVHSDAATTWPVGVAPPDSAPSGNGSATGETAERDHLDGAGAPAATTLVAGATAAVHTLPAAATFREHSATLFDATLSADGRLGISCDAAGLMLFWDPVTLRTLQRVAFTSEARGAALMPKSGLAIAAAACRPQGGELRVWNLRTLGEIHRIPLTQPPDRLLLASDTSRSAVLAMPGELEAWSLDDRVSLWRVPLSAGRVYDAAQTADGWRIVLASDRSLSQLDIESGRVESECATAAGPFVAAALSADGRWAITVGEDLVLRWWNVESGADNVEEQSQIPLAAAPRCLALSHDGQLAAVASQDRQLKVLKLPGGGVVCEWELPGTTGRTLRFAPDGRLVLGGEDHCVRIYTVRQMSNV